MSDEHPTPLEKLPEKERRSVFVQAVALLIVPASIVILLVLLATAGAVWWDSRERSQANRGLIERLKDQADALREANQRDDELRAELVRGLRRADLVNCRENEKQNERIRATVMVREDEFNQALTQLGIDPGSPQGRALLKQAKDREAETLERFRPRNCKALVNRP